MKNKTFASVKNLTIGKGDGSIKWKADFPKAKNIEWKAKFKPISKNII